MLLLASTSLSAATDKYRLVVSSDPATTITIGWNQVSGKDARVYYGTADRGRNYGAYQQSASAGESNESRGMRNRFVRLAKLKANTNYFFVIADETSTSRRFWFRTAPKDDSRLSFIAGGDSRNNRGPRRNANSLVPKLKPHAVFFGGDMIDRDAEVEWREWFDDWQVTIANDGRMFPLVPARGNHELGGAIEELFGIPATEYYALTWGKNLIRTYTLNTEVSVAGLQVEWLRDDLLENTNTRWKLAQYHRPMRPHVTEKPENNFIYESWAQLFFDHDVRLVIDCDSHAAKTTWPIQPSREPDNDEGFVRNDVYGTVYTGEGCWGAPLRDADDTKSWTRSSGAFNQFNLIFVGTNAIEVRMIATDNAAMVAEAGNNKPFKLPRNLDVFKTPDGELVKILPLPGTELPEEPEGTKIAEAAPADISGIGLPRPYANGLAVFPNPTEQILYLTSLRSTTKIELLDAQGRIARSFNGDVDRLDLGGFPAGIYFLRVWFASGSEELVRVILR